MLPEHRQALAEALLELSEPRPDARPSEWVEENIEFDEPDCRERWSFDGRHYLEKPIDWWADEESTDLTFVAGTRTGKTRGIFAGLGWSIVHIPARCLYVMPNTDGTGGAKNVSRTRLQPMIRATGELARLIPDDEDLFKTMQLIIGGAIIDLTGANSPANLSGNPCRIVIQDEIDKYPPNLRNEAGSVELADERSAEYTLPKRIKTSSPTVTEGQIWQSLLGSNIHRRFIPCRGCGQLVVLSWTKRMQVLPLDGREAFVEWDKEAKRPSGWDYDRVERSAHYLCPHCGHHIMQPGIIAGDAVGVWECVKAGAPRHIGLHLPSLYSSSVQMSPGRLAIQFLKSKASFGGLQNFVNSKLGEPWESQDAKIEFVGNIITNPKRDEGEKVEKVLTVDVQQTVPHFYYVIREWTPSGDSRRLEFGHLDRYSEIAECQMDHGIKNVRVGLDCGDQESEESQYESDVYAQCLKRGVILKNRHIGWIPMRGMKAQWRHRDKEGRETIVGLTKNPIMLGRVLLWPMLFSGDQCLDIWDALMKGKESADGRKWELVQQDNEADYERHMSGKLKGRRDASGRTWRPRSHRAPAHWLDCEKMSIALALYCGWLTWGIVEEVKRNE